MDYSRSRVSRFVETPGLTPGPGAYDVAGLLPDANRARAPAFSLGYGKR